MARAALGLGIRELADAAKVSPDTIARLERGEILRERTVEAIQDALEAAGVMFIAENGDGPGVRLRKRSTTDPPHAMNLRVAIKDRRPVRVSYDGGAMRWFAPHALYRAHDGTAHVRGATLARWDGRSSPTIRRQAVVDDFDLALISSFELARPGHRFRPAPGFASADIGEAVTIDRAVDLL